MIVGNDAANTSDDIDRLWQLDGPTGGFEGGLRHDGAVLLKDGDNSDSPGEILSDGAPITRARAVSETNGKTLGFRMGGAMRPRLSEHMSLRR